MMETFCCVSGWMDGCGSPRACGRVVWVVRQWEMGGFGERGGQNAGIFQVRYRKGEVDVGNRSRKPENRFVEM